MKGVLLCGGKGTRLLPATRIINKHLIPILNRPMIEYPIDTLKQFGIEDILIISGGNHIGDFADYLGDGSEFGVSLTYRVQKEAGGIGQALSLAKDFAGTSDVVTILGDNIFGSTVPNEVRADNTVKSGKDWAHIWVKEVPNASRFGVYLDGSIIEKPEGITKGLAVTGLYVYPPDVFSIIPTLRPSLRGEIEITDVNNYYLKHNRCSVSYLYEHDFWSDAGTPVSLFEATRWAYGGK